MAYNSIWRAERSSKKKYTVPKSEQKDYKEFIKRANERIKESYKYIEEHDIKSFSTQRAILSIFEDKKNWETKTNPLSTKVNFRDQRAYLQFMNFVGEWGDGKKSFDRSLKNIRVDYRKSIIETLNRTMIKNQIPSDNGQIPEQILRRINRMTITQLTNFYGDEFAEEQENARFDSKGERGDGSGKRNVEAGDLDSFITYINKQIDWVRQAYPEKRKAKKKKLKNKKSKGILKRSKSIVKKPKEYLNHTSLKHFKK